MDAGDPENRAGNPVIYTERFIKNNSKTNEFSETDRASAKSCCSPIVLTIMAGFFPLIAAYCFAQL